MKKLFSAAIFGSAMLLSAGAQAQDSNDFLTGWYLELQAGSYLGENPDVTTTSVGNDDYDPDNVFTLVGAVGKNITDNILAEFQVSWTNAGDDDYAGFPHDGSADTWTLMLNGIYAFDLGRPVRPYVGAGVGVGIYDVDNLGAVGGAFVVDDTEMVFQGVGILGVDYHFNEWLALTARFTGGWSDGATFNTSAAGVKSKMDDRMVYAIIGGFRVTMN